MKTGTVSIDREDKLHPSRGSRGYWVNVMLRRGVDEFIRGFAEVFADGVALDYGSGDSPYRPLFAPYARAYLAADLAVNPAAELVLDEQGRVPLADGSVDVAISTQTLEHVPDPGLHLAEIRRVLSPRGVALISTHGVWSYHPHPLDLWRWTGAGLKRLLGDAGFEVLAFRGVLGPAATALQLWQDSVRWRVPARLRPLFFRAMQALIERQDRRASDAERDRDAAVYMVAVAKAGAGVPGPAALAGMMREIDGLEAGGWREGWFRLVHAYDEFAEARPFKGSSRLQRYGRRSLLYRARDHQIVPTRFGFRMVVHPHYDQSIFTRGVYERGTLAVMDRALRPGDNFIDIGANLGLMSLFAAQKVGPGGQVHAFEPEPFIFELLRKNVELNRAENVRLNRGALGAAPGSARLYPNLEVSAGASSLIRKETQREEEGTLVKVGTLDDYLERGSFPPPRMLKIDVEGFELEVLKGARRLLASPAAPIICVEHALDNPSLGEEEGGAAAFLGAINDYAVFRLRDGKERRGKLIRIERPEDLPRHDNLFCFPRWLLAEVPGDLFA